ncbi:MULTISPECIES: sigma-70 family RNA polymerase sigma factor [Nocardioides]|uniref:Sigma-70 family RNA polymerase sigma factor n=1 Tax=Nocardioides vastitatis TaxID=2568655 RepID=A0ABW0ZN93_9ACTN|nr:sigma-70 family RNA polymerase sigma factor [Nocardioides sp.]
MAQPADSVVARLVHERGDWLLRCAYLLTRSRDAALDLTQDTLARAWTARERVEAADHPDRYVLRIMLNLHRTTSRRSRLREVELLEAQGLAAAADPVAAVDEQHRIAHGLALLSDRQRSVLVLRYWADFDDAAIADVIGCRRATVRSLAARGMAALKSHLEAAE